MINYNGTLYPADQPIFTAQNRAFRYGDGLFESIRLFNGSNPFLHLHFSRLFRGMEHLHFSYPEAFNALFLEEEMYKLTGFNSNRRVRINVFRADGGLYTPVNYRPQFLIETEPLESPIFELNAEGLTIEICPTAKTEWGDPLSNLKTNNSLIYILASIYKREQGLGDCLLLNSRNRIAEASSSNIFMVLQNKLLTPSLEEGCIDGTIRHVIINAAHRVGLEAEQKPLSLFHLENAEEVFLTNATQGIRWVGRFREKTYANEMSRLLVSELNKKVQFGERW